MPIAEKHHSTFSALNGAIADAKHILLATHLKPDADAIGGVFALAHIASHHHKPVSLFLPDGIPDTLSFLKTDAPVYAVPQALPGDLLIAIDYGDFSRTKLHDYAGVAAMRIATVDHHAGRDHRGDVMIVDPDASATCELLYRFCKDAGVPITRDMATCLLAGIMFDTSGLRHSNTTLDTVQVVSDLVQRGARMHRISKVLRGTESPLALAITAGALERIAFDEELRMSYAVVYNDELKRAGDNADLSPITDLLGTGSEHKFAAVFKEIEPGLFHISLRSEDFKGVNVSAIANKLGGGGHMYASACRVPGDFPAVLERVRQAAKEVLQSA